MLKILSLFPRYSFLNPKTVHYCRILRGTFFFFKKHYRSRIYGGIYGVGKVQDPRHPHLTSETNYSFSSSEQKEKEEEQNASENLSIMSVE